MTRPLVHYTPPSGWMNDPHGVTWHNGQWHLFYQANDAAPDWVPGIAWGHATSEDLVTWTAAPIAFRPAPDETGCWTGCLVAPEGRAPVIFYTSVRAPDLDRAMIRAAHPMDDSWTTWTPGRVVAQTPPGLDVFRDPIVLPDESGWRMIVGGGRGQTGVVVSFRSQDLATWTYAGELAASPEHQWLGSGWECPQLFRLPDHDVLAVGVWESGVTHQISAAVGSYTGDRFETDRWEDATVGEGHYAATRFVDREGRECVIFWIREQGDADAGWAGALSIPYLVSVRDTRVWFTPHDALRGDALPAGGELHTASWTPAPGDTLRLVTAAGELSASLEFDGTVVHVRTPHRAERLPYAGGDVELIADGPVLEVCTGIGLSGVSIQPVARVIASTPGTAHPW